jgi:hypothetical protein
MKPVRTNRKNVRWLLALAPLLLGAGCSGINSTQSVSPLDFLLPGSSLFHLQYTPKPAVPGSNACFASVQPSSTTVLPQ